MPTVSKKSGDAALGKDGSVKLNGKIVGVWWKDGDFDVFHVTAAKTDLLRARDEAFMPHAFAMIFAQ